MLGIGLSYLPILHHFAMEPELFLIIVIAPLLFNDSQNANLKKVFTTFKSTFALSVILAIIMTVIIEVILNWQFTLFSLPLAILLGTIVTPTDAVAVKSILTRWHKLVQLQTNQQNMINSDTLNEEYVQGFQLEYQYLSDSVANHTITKAVAKELADVIANSELVQFQTHYFGNE